MWSKAISFYSRTAVTTKRWVADWLRLKGVAFTDCPAGDAQSVGETQARIPRCFPSAKRLAGRSWWHKCRTLANPKSFKFPYLFILVPGHYIVSCFILDFNFFIIFFIYLHYFPYFFSWYNWWEDVHYYVPITWIKSSTFMNKNLDSILAQVNYRGKPESHYPLPSHKIEGVY